MTDQELKEILERHQHYLNQDCDGWVSMRADLSDADLRGVDLKNANLVYVIMAGVDLRDAILDGADLSYTYMHKANLSGAHLRCTRFCGAVLTNANLSDAFLYNTNFRYAGLIDATLPNMNTDDNVFYGAILTGAHNVPYIPLYCPEEGSFIAYKKARGYIVKLKIPADAKRSSATTRKCRCNKAIVLDIQNADETKALIDSVRSDFCKDLFYRIGDTVIVDNFDDNRWNECSTGIHFFMNRQDAVDYVDSINYV